MWQRKLTLVECRGNYHRFFPSPLTSLTLWFRSPGMAATGQAGHQSQGRGNGMQGTLRAGPDHTDQTLHCPPHGPGDRGHALISCVSREPPTLPGLRTLQHPESNGWLPAALQRARGNTGTLDLTPSPSYVGLCGMGTETPHSHGRNVAAGVLSQGALSALLAWLPMQIPPSGGPQRTTTSRRQGSKPAAVWREDGVQERYQE